MKNIIIKFRTSQARLIWANINYELEQQINQSIKQAILSSFEVLKDFSSFEVLNFEVSGIEAYFELKTNAENLANSWISKNNQDWILCDVCGRWVWSNEDICDCYFLDWFKQHYSTGDFDFEDLSEEVQNNLKQDFEEHLINNRIEFDIEKLINNKQAFELILNHILNKHNLNIEYIKEV